MPYTHTHLPRRDVIAALIRSEHAGNVSAAARTCGITPAALHDILSGRRHGKTETLQAIADGLRVTLSVISDPVDDEAA